MRVATFHTGGAYEASARRLVDSGRAHGVGVEVHALPDRGDWWKNVSQKPALVSRLLADGGPLVVLDADCLLHAPLAPLAGLLGRADLVIRHRPPGFGVMFNTGVTVWNNTPAARRLAARWATLTLKYGWRYETCDQPTLELAMEWAGHVEVVDLPAAYNVMRHDVVPDPVVTHRKDSRTVPGVAEKRKLLRIECGLAGRLREWAETTPALAVHLLGPDAPAVPRSPGVEAHAVGWLPTTWEPDCVWTDDPEVVAEIIRRGRGRVAFPVQAAGRRLVAAVRALPGDHDLLPATVPPRTAVAYYPTHHVRGNARMAELCSRSLWHAAANATSFRGADVYAPAARAAELRCVFPAVRAVP